MRVLFLTDNYLPHRGGSRVYYHEILSHLSHFWSIHVATRGHRDARAFDQRAPYRIRRMRLRAWSWLRPVRLQHLPIYLRLFVATLSGVVRLRPDMFMAGELVPTGPVAALIGKFLHIPLVVFTHAEGPSTLARTRLQSRLARWVCKRAVLIVAASENARVSLIEDLGVGAGKIEVMPPGVSKRHLDDAFRAKPFSGASGPRLLSVGRLLRRKGLLHVLEALPEVIARHPGLRHTIVGTGPLEGRIRDAVDRLGLQDRVRLTGDVTDEELLQLYASSDCFILPNYDDPTTGDTEGFVIVFGEASAHGLPIVAGRDGGTAHSVLDGRTGFRIDGSNPIAVRKALLQLLGDPERAREMGKNGREFAARHLCWYDRAQTLEALVTDILDNG